MAEPLKLIYNNRFLDQYCSVLSSVIIGFDPDSFRSKVLSDEWDGFELKQRMQHLTLVTGDVLPECFKDKMDCIIKIIEKLRSLGVKDQNFEYIFLADIVPMYGLDDLNTSIKAIEDITQFTSFEFAGRAFFVHHPQQMMAQMLKWSQHKNPNVRRYASEGCRPRLPWGLQLKEFVKDPSPIIPILEKLKDDPSEYVRKSVANNLNDISKDHPQLIIDIIKKWKGASKNTDWILKHAARTLLKKGHDEVLDLFGTPTNLSYELLRFQIDKTSIALGDTLGFEFEILNNENTPANFRVEYLIEFVKSNGQTSRKIFKICESKVSPNDTLSGARRHKFIDLTTRKHYAGTHSIALVVNGVENTRLSFELSISST